MLSWAFSQQVGAMFCQDWKQFQWFQLLGISCSLLFGMRIDFFFFQTHTLSFVCTNNTIVDHLKCWSFSHFQGKLCLCIFSLTLAFSHTQWCLCFTECVLKHQSFDLICHFPWQTAAWQVVSQTVQSCSSKQKCKTFDLLDLLLFVEKCHQKFAKLMLCAKKNNTPHSVSWNDGIKSCSENDTTWVFGKLCILWFWNLAKWPFAASSTCLGWFCSSLVFAVSVSLIWNEARWVMFLECSWKKPFQLRKSVWKSCCTNLFRHSKQHPLVQLTKHGGQHTTAAVLADHVGCPRWQHRHVNRHAGVIWRLLVLLMLIAGFKGLHLGDAPQNPCWHVLPSAWRSSSLIFNLDPTMVLLRPSSSLLEACWAEDCTWGRGPWCVGGASSVVGGSSTACGASFRLTWWLFSVDVQALSDLLVGQGGDCAGVSFGWQQGVVFGCMGWLVGWTTRRLVCHREWRWNLSMNATIG